MSVLKIKKRDTSRDPNDASYKDISLLIDWLATVLTVLSSFNSVSSLHHAISTNSYNL